MQHEPLERVETLVSDLLTTSMKLGQVVIMTIAQEPWVETSCRNFMPGVMPFLSQIPVRCAHEVHEGDFGSQEVLTTGPKIVNLGSMSELNVN